MAIRIQPVWAGIAVGTLASIAFGLTYIVVLHEPGAGFYPFAALTFLGAAIIGGTVAALTAQQHSIKAFIAAVGAVFGVACALFVITYAVWPQFSRTSLLLPATCHGYDGSFDPPARLTYNLPGIGAGLLIASDTESAVVALVDPNPPYPARVYLVNTSNDKILLGLQFGNDVVSAAMDGGIAYIYNDKIGFFIDARTGELEQNLFTIDNYGGLSQTDRPVVSGATSDNWYLETTAVISSWNRSGSVVSRRFLTFNGIARGCFVSGSAHEVIPY